MVSTATTHTNPSTTTSGLRVIELRYEELTDDFVDKWNSLESHSIEGNAFLSPHFVIPAVEHLTNASQKKPLILAVESQDRSRLLAIGLFEETRNSRLLPMTHLQSWRCEHTLYDGLLVDRQHGSEAMTTLFQWLSKQSRRWQGIAFTDRSADGTLNRWLEDAAEQTGMTWFEDWSRERAIIPVEEVPEDCMTLYSKNRRRYFRRGSKLLSGYGDVTFRCLSGSFAIEPSVQSFLELEAMGWKSDQGTAFLSSPNQEHFCRDIAARFSDDQRLVICELSIDGTPVASSFNLLSAEDIFGFKVGWNPDFASGSPGVLNELNTLQNCRTELNGIRLIDSCSKTGSFVEDVWPWKRRLTTGVFTTTRTGTLAANAMSQLKRLKRMLKKA